MSSKIFRDPLYNYISIDRENDQWLLDLLDSPEMQRLRRIHQLGISNLTYPSADHNRLAHSLGVLHLMQQACHRLERIRGEAAVEPIRDGLLAAALIHDVGHGPFSHLFEPCLGIDHEYWSKVIILGEETAIHRILRDHDPSLPETVAGLIDADNQDLPSWPKLLISSQLDMDRLDYLRRDSLITGAGYGHFDWYRLLNTFEIDEEPGGDIVWPDKARLAIEEYIFARYYMYQNVYLHKTTRGFEKVIEAAWRRARTLYNDGGDAGLMPAIKEFWAADARSKEAPAQPGPAARQYLAIEEFTVLMQVQAWTDHPDKALSDLSRRFLERRRFAMVEAPIFEDPLAPDYKGWEDDLNRLVASRVEYSPPQMFWLRDQVKAKYHQPYFPEKESDEQSVRTAIRVRPDGERKAVEISELLPRLKPLTQKAVGRPRYYVPKELQAEANRLRETWNNRPEARTYVLDYRI
jgi:HD superfamily phosphohydrolase